MSGSRGAGKKPKSMNDNVKMPPAVNLKLKIFGLVSVDKNLQLAIDLKNKVILTLSAAYISQVATAGAIEGIKNLGLNPENYHIGFVGGFKEIDEFIQLPAIKSVSSTEAEPTKEEIQQSVQKATFSVFYVFDRAGTAEERKIAKEVVEKFKKLYN